MKKIAVPITSNNTIANHFGRSKFYEIYTFTSNNEIIDLKLLESEAGSQCKSTIINLLVKEGVSLILTANIGAPAYQKLNDAGIRVIRGCSGKSSEVILQYIDNKISDSGVSCLHRHHKRNNGRVCNH